MPPRSASVQRRAERVSVSRDAKRARAAKPPSCFQAPLCRRWRSRARDGPASERQGAQAKAPSPGPDRRVDEGRESGSARFQAAAVPQARRDRCAAQRWLPEARPKADADAQRERPATRGAGFCLARREAGVGGEAAVLFPCAALSALAKPRAGRPGKRAVASAGEGAEGAEPRAGPGARTKVARAAAPVSRRPPSRKRGAIGAQRSGGCQRRGRRPMPTRSASVQRCAERVSVSRDAKRAWAAKPPSCFQRRFVGAGEAALGTARQASGSERRRRRRRRRAQGRTGERTKAARAAAPVSRRPPRSAKRSESQAPPFRKRDAIGEPRSGGCQARPKADADAQRERPAVRGAGFCLARREAGVGGEAAVLFPGALCRRWRSRARDGPASDRQGAQAKAPKAPSPGPDPARGRSPRERQRPFPGGRREARRGASARRRRREARSVQRSAELFPWLFLRPASARLAGPARMRGKPRPKGGAEHRDARSRAGVSFRGRASKKGEGPALAAASADPVERKRHAVTCMTGMPACRALSTRLAVMPAPGNATMPFGRRLMMSSFLRNGAALP